MSDWLASLGAGDDEDASQAIDDQGGSADGAGAWLASLAGNGSENTTTTSAAHATSGEASDEVEDSAAWLEDMGFATDAVRAALGSTGGDADEALRRLRQELPVGEEEQEEAESGGEAGQSAKRRRLAVASEDLMDMEGFKCRLHGKRLFLYLPQVGLDGPEVGRVKTDGSMSFRGVDEWSQELYHSASPRPVPAKQQLSADAFDAATACEALAAGEPFVWRDFASEDEVMSAHAEMEELNASGLLSAAAAGTTAAVKARSDKVAFVSVCGDRPSCPPNMLKLYRRLEAAAAALEWPRGEQLLMPRLGMASIYDADGSRYEAHRDNERDSRSRWLNHRALSMIAYVNPTGFQRPEDGGQLRCHVGASTGDRMGASASRVEDIAPKGGVAVLFDARRVLHEVLPSHARRYALTLWLLSIPHPGAASDAQL